MNSRRKIEKFCKENNILIEKLEYERNGQYIYGDYSDESQWYCQYFFMKDKEYRYESYAYTADELIEAIKYDWKHAI